MDDEDLQDALESVQVTQTINGALFWFLIFSLPGAATATAALFGFLLHAVVALVLFIVFVLTLRSRLVRRAASVTASIVRIISVGLVVWLGLFTAVMIVGGYVLMLRNPAPGTEPALILMPILALLLLWYVLRVSRRQPAPRSVESSRR